MLDKGVDLGSVLPDMGGVVLYTRYEDAASLALHFKDRTQLLSAIFRHEKKISCGNIGCSKED
jgi:hypothetical protein